MSRRLIAASVMLLLATAPGRAAEAEVSTNEAPEEDSDQRFGASLGIATGATGVTPGGFRLAGSYLYRMTERSWFDGEVGFSFGGGGADCFLDRDRQLVCDHGLADGFGATLSGGVRYAWPRRPSGFQPYVRGGATLFLARFGDDDVSGGGLAPYLGAGGRFRVANRVHVGGEALLTVGVGGYTRDLGLELLAGMTVTFGVEFEL
jgi:hypothetical protein